MATRYSSVVIAGAQWGDEGKGKIVDVLTEKAAVVARYQGGHNAGHTVVINDETFILHLVPSGILHRGKLSVIGNGTVVEPTGLIGEIDGLVKRGVRVGKNLMLSSGAHLIMPYHMAVEAAAEGRRGSGKIGTTGRGIGPAYVDKMSRIGLKVGDLLRPATFREKLEANLAYTNSVLENVYGAKTFSAEDVYSAYMGHAERLAPYIGDTEIAVNKALDAGKNVLFEGAQGALLDIDHGTYPFVTSSSPTAGGVCTGLGVGPTRIGKVLGVVKAYTTRVGSGPFPTELDNPLGSALRQRGGEYGATTGRPRRCGWLDMVALRHSARVNGLTGIVVTKLDIMDGLDEVKICTYYRHGEKRLREFPGDAAVLSACTPQYETLPGWKKKTTGLTSFGRLPDEAKRYLARIEELLGVDIYMVSTGPKRGQMITRKNAFR